MKSKTAHGSKLVKHANMPVCASIFQSVSDFVTGLSVKMEIDLWTWNKLQNGTIS